MSTDTKLNTEQRGILEHTKRNGRYCGRSKDMTALVEMGLMRLLGKVAWWSGRAIQANSWNAGATKLTAAKTNWGRQKIASGFAASRIQVLLTQWPSNGARGFNNSKGQWHEQSTATQAANEHRGFCKAGGGVLVRTGRLCDKARKAPNNGLQ